MSQLPANREPAVQHLTIEINTAIQVVPFAQDLDVGLVHQPRHDRGLALLADGIGQCRSELLDPAQDRSAADVNAAIGEDASDAFGCRTKLQVIANSEQDDVTREAMTRDQARRLGCGMAPAGAAGVDDPATSVAAIASEIG
jgi:hypothetical protein